ncbi:MAG: GAF domain-containing protein [Holophagales bacterium]|nr:GAF domain-containing protein [Holophagales bacterium]
MRESSSEELLTELGAAVGRAREIVAALESRDPESPGAGVDAESAERIRELEGRLDARDRDREELTARLVEAEHQLGRLMNLYVATFQLHATLDPTEVQATIAEIAVDLLGAERFALLLREDGNNECEVALSRGLEQDSSGLYSGDKYSGGDPLVDAALEDGVLRMGPDELSEVIAAVPLRVQDAIVGVLVVLKLFDHKSILRAEDRDLLDLLAAHAASALFAARVYSNTDRKLRTLESLVQLVRST